MSAAPDAAVRALLASTDARGGRTGLIVADLLAEQGRVDEAITILQARADADDEYATWKLADLLAEQGRVDEAITILQIRANVGHAYATWRLADLRSGRPLVQRNPSRVPPGESAGSVPVRRSVATATAGHEDSEGAGLEDPLRRQLPVVLYQGTRALVTTEYFESDGYRYPLGDLENFERVEHGGWLQPSRLYELWAWFRESRTRLLYSDDPQEFSQICRALTRALEHAGLASSSQLLRAARLNR